MLPDGLIHDRGTRSNDSLHCGRYKQHFAKYGSCWRLCFRARVHSQTSFTGQGPLCYPMASYTTEALGRMIPCTVADTNSILQNTVRVGACASEHVSTVKLASPGKAPYATRWPH